jgi:hypothetical protein
MIDLEKFKNECFIEFDKFFINSNHKAIQSYRKENTIGGVTNDLVISKFLDEHKNRALLQIFEILIKEPNADYFWFDYKGSLSYSLPHHEVVPSDSLRVSKKSVKPFLRELKIDQILSS